MLISITLYTLCWLISFVLVNIQYKHYLKVNPLYASKSSSYISKPSKKMPIWLILLICTLFTSYNYYTTTTNAVLGADRQNYLFEFEGSRESPSIGMFMVMGAFSYFNFEFETLLYVSSFISLFFPLLAYRYSKDATPLSLLLLFLSLYIINSFTALKQCYTNAFSTLALVLLFQNKTKSKEIAIILLIILSMFFHPTGFILVPIYVFCRYFDTNYNVKRLIFFIFLFSLFFEPLLRLIGSALSFIPFLSEKIDEYFGSGSGEWEEHGFMSVLKGLPFYYIAFWGIKLRGKLKEYILFYDEYLLITIICSFFFIMNVYNYWMSRFMFLFLFVIYTFFCTMAQYLPNRKQSIIAVLIMTAVITYRDIYLVYTLWGAF